jgi:hypothetical protein
MAFDLSSWLSAYLRYRRFIQSDQFKPSGGTDIVSFAMSVFNFSGTGIPVKVGITIGDDNGNVTLKNTRLVAGSQPLKSEPDDNAEFP